MSIAIRVRPVRPKGSRSAGIVGVHPIHTLCRDWKQQLEHSVADPGPGRAELPLAVAIASRERNDALHAWPPFGFEGLKRRTGLVSFLHQSSQPHGVFQRQRGTLASMRTGGMRGI